MEMFKHENPGTYRKVLVRRMVKAKTIKTMHAKITAIHPDDAYHDIKHRFIGVIGTANRVIPYDDLPNDMRHAFPAGDWCTCDFLADKVDERLDGQEDGGMAFHAVRIEEVESE